MTIKHNTHDTHSMKRDAINIAINVFRAGITNYTEANQELLTWLWGYTFEELGGSKAMLTKQLGHNYATIHQALTGHLNNEDLVTFMTDVAALQKRAVKSIDLVETIVTRRISEVLDYARDMCAVVSIQGPTGRSKTYTAQHWARHNNHGRSKYIRVPSGCSRRTLVQLLAKKSGIRTIGQKTTNLEWRLTQAYNSRNVIIIDEAGHLMPRTGHGTNAIEFLRDLHDMCGCGVALIFTDVYLDEMKHGKLASYFEQFLGRIKFQLNIPTDVMRDEIRAVVASFTPEPTLKLQQFAYSVAQNRDGKLRTLFEDLERARDWAQAHNRDTLSFNDLLKAVEWRKSGGIWPED